MYGTRCMCVGPTASMPKVQPTFEVNHKPSSGVGSIQGSNTQDLDIPRQHTLSFSFPYCNHTWTFSRGWECDLTRITCVWSSPQGTRLSWPTQALLYWGGKCRAEHWKANAIRDSVTMPSCQLHLYYIDGLWSLHLRWKFWNLCTWHYLLILPYL